VNEAVRQEGSTSNMIFSVAEVLVHVSRSVTIEAGDVILTGTPEGVGPLVAGDRLRISVDAIGALEATVAPAP
jgi:2-keto-4-pentenoate hydratase/2-oxohepta-3-ene-1,7-dioic acid hydratase in catechol pathway